MSPSSEEGSGPPSTWSARQATPKLLLGMLDIRRMKSAVEVAVDTYIRASTERDAAVRGQLLEECFAADGRMVTASREIRGREALAEMLTRFYANPQLSCVRVTSAVEARGTTFRYRAVAEMRDGTTAEVFDAGEIDATGRISLILTFAGVLGDVED